MKGGKVFTRLDYERINRLIQESKSDSPAERLTIRKLKEALTHCKPIEPRKVKSNVVTMNSKFSLKNIGNGMKETYSLVYPQDCDGSRDKLSILSMIGAEALGSAIGTIIKADTGSEQYYPIEDILYQPEAAGHHHL